MQKIADKDGFGKSFKEKTEQFDKHIQQKKEKQNSKEQKVEKRAKKDRGLSL